MRRDEPVNEAWREYWAGIEDAEHAVFYKGGVEEAFISGWVAALRQMGVEAAVEADRVYDLT